MLALLVTTACDRGDIFMSESTVTGDVKAGLQQDGGSDPQQVTFEVSDGTAPSHTAFLEGELSTSSQLLGTAWNATLEVNGGDTHAEATLQKSVCVTATTEFLTTFFTMSFQFEKSGLPGDAGTIDVSVDHDITVNGDTLEDEGFHWTASGSLDQPTFMTSGPPPVEVNLPNFRYFTFVQQLELDDIAVQVGDEIRLDTVANLRLELAPGSSQSRLELDGTYTSTIDIGDLHPCTEPECLDDPNCPTTEICERGRCVDLRLLSPPVDAVFTTTPSPFGAGQPFSFDVAFNVHAGDLLPSTIAIAVEQPGLDFTGGAAPNQGFGICAVAPGLNRLLLGTADPLRGYVDVNGNASVDPNDPTIDVTEGATNLEVLALFPNGGAGDATIRTLPVDARVECQVFHGVLSGGPAGIYDGSVVVTSVDPNSPGLEPLTRTFAFTLDNGTFTESEDRDGDGVSDDEDACPDDPSKQTAPGACGCGAPETDTDGDGTPDCVDACHDDPSKTEPGLCGCGVADDEHGLPCDTGNPGRCSDGERQCSEGSNLCLPLFEPTDEVCNGIDDDCDGAADTGVCQETSFSSFEGSFRLNAKPLKDKFSWQGELPSAGLALDPATDGVTITAVQNQQTIFEVHLEPGARWKSSKNGDKSTFTDDGSSGGPGKDAFVLQLDARKQIFTMKGSTQKVDLPAVSAGIITVNVFTGDDHVTDTQRWVGNDKGTKVATVKGGAFCGDGIKNGTEECDGAEAAACAGACRADCTCPPPSREVYVLGHFLEKAGATASTPFTFDTTIFATYTGGLAGTPGSGGAVVDIFLYDDAAGNPLQSNGQVVCNPCTRAIGGPGQPRKLSFAIEDALSATGAFDEVQGFGVVGVTGDSRNVKLNATLANSHTGPADLAATFVDLQPPPPAPSGSRTFVLPHFIEKSGAVPDGVEFTFDTDVFATYVGGLGGVEEGPDLGGGTRATIELYLFDQVTGQPLENGAGTATVCNPCTFAVGTAGQPRQRAIRIDDLIVAAGGFGGLTDPVVGFGIIVVTGDADAVSLQGFVTNSHESPFDLAPFAFVPEEVRDGSSPPCF